MRCQEEGVHEGVEAEGGEDGAGVVVVPHAELCNIYMHASCIYTNNNSIYLVGNTEQRSPAARKRALPHTHFLHTRVASAFSFCTSLAARRSG